MLNFLQKTFLAALVVAAPCFSTPLPRPQLYPAPDNEPEPAIASKRQGDLDSQGTFGINSFSSPLGGVYGGVGSVNPYSYGLGSIGTAYGVNQLNAGGLGGIPGGFGAAGGVGALGPAGLGGYGGIGGLGGGLGGLGGGYQLGGYQLGGLGGLGGINGGYLGGGNLGLLGGAGGLYSPYGMYGGLGGQYGGLGLGQGIGGGLPFGGGLVG
ncbi:unnamed protein product [Orchesella dallaii]|uniref:Uncharacterized protein n=1 Tax=Orchesella dallaii TaxID=48710 RepID=A0ABP1QL29_9HEXA